MAVNGTFYGRDRFDPILILAQIVLLQASFYTSYLLLLVMFNYATGTTASITDQMFNHTYITLRHFPGWVTCTALLISAAGPAAIAFVALVGRAKRCIDFACTLFISHIIATTVHSGFPNTIMWWLLNIVATAALSTVGEAVSLRLELREIAIPRDNPTRTDKRDQPTDIEAALNDHSSRPNSSSSNADAAVLAQAV
ncbi:Protein SYS1-like [Gracilariopsis chorda]|uniref:Protein SYS1-like n=1 Tax=Gracilariopsis chorda TaxID=448386 RepID=A0A2V3IZY5_9FLOR|nr:Protein SYS1-like [Gracilariopsis chorda]|eukprot:PXF47722.1 Protein SYS1-like [Gracilariopsis chorda]